MGVVHKASPTCGKKVSMSDHADCLDVSEYFYEASGASP